MQKSQLTVFSAALAVALAIVPRPHIANAAGMSFGGGAGIGMSGSLGLGSTGPRGNSSVGMGSMGATDPGDTVSDGTVDQRSVPAAEDAQHGDRRIGNISGTGLRHFVVLSPARAGLPQLDPNIVSALVPVPAIAETPAVQTPADANNTASQDGLPKLAAAGANSSTR
jgi:hypothetical protein